MTNVDSDRPSAPRASSGGSPSARSSPAPARRVGRRRAASSRRAPSGSYRMFWLTWRTTPARSHASTSAAASRIRHRQRLLRQDAPDAAGMARIRRITPGCSLGGTATSTTSTAGSSSISSRVAIDLRDSPQRGHFPRGLDRPRRDPDHAEPGIGVGHQVAVADDEARPDDADPGVSPSGSSGSDSGFSKGSLASVSIRIHRRRSGESS